MKLKRLAMPAVIFTAQLAAAQPANEVVTAELAFAGTAKTQTMKQAFLQYMDSTAVVFNAGVISNGFESWSKAQDNNAKLLWYPVFFGISRAGDLGFTTGPWEYRATMQDSVAGSGNFTTIWRKNKNGQWKFLVDLGVSYRSSLFGKELLLPANEFASAGKTDTSALSVEDNFLQAYHADKQNSFRQFLHSNSWLNTDGKQPLHTTTAILAELNSLPPETDFQPIAGGMSSSRDIAYVYGVVQYEKKKENYLRIWGYGREGWRIIVQVIKR